LFLNINVPKERSIDTVTERQQQQAVNEFIISPPGGDERDYSTNSIYQNGPSLTLEWLTNYTKTTSSVIIKICLMVVVAVTHFSVRISISTLP
jgi:hypothetical protein